MAAQLVTSLYVSGYLPAAGGSVRFYQVGTTTPVNVYNNDAATQVITQPVPLDATGKPVVPVYATAPLRAIIYDSNGAQLLDIERIDGNRAETVSISNTGWPGEATLDQVLTALSSSLGGTDGKVKVSGSGAISRTAQAKFSEGLSVQDFGALGNGVNDDTGAFVSAITAAGKLGGAVILVPAGNYVISSAMTISTNGISFRGTGALTSVLTNTSGSGNVFNISASRFFVEDIGIAAQSTSTGIGINLNPVAANGYGTLSRVRITGHRTSAVMGGSRQLFRDCEFVTDGNAASACISIVLSTTAGMVQNCILNAGNTTGGHCIDISAGNLAVLGMTITGSYFQGGSSGFNLAATSTNAFGFTISACVFGSAGVLNLTWTLGNTGTAIYFSEIGNIDLSPSSSGGRNTDQSGAKGNMYSMPSYGWRPAGYGGQGANITAGNTFTVDNTQSSYFYVNATSAGTVTISAPTVTGGSQAAPMYGKAVYITASNSSGGAVTWSWSAFYRMSGVVAPANGTAITLQFLWNNDLAKWVEVNRSAAI